MSLLHAASASRESEAKTDRITQIKNTEKYRIAKIQQNGDKKKKNIST